MTGEKWETVVEVFGELEAEMLRGLLEAQGIPVILNQEGAGRAYGLNVGPLGMVQILVRESTSSNARKVLDDYYAGKFEEMSPQEEDDYEEDSPNGR
ncbi:MAG TPA: DUF2007 domain-containing protein [Anaerolineales bacterium]